MGQARWLCRAELPGRKTGCRQSGLGLASVSNDGQRALFGKQALALLRERERELRGTEVNFKAHFVPDLNRTQPPLAISLGELVPPRGQN